MQKETLKIEEVLALQGQYVGPTVGVSMLPMLKNRRETIVVKPKTERLQPLDVALYRRGKDYVLHRVIASKDGGYLIRGDNTYTDEFVPEESVFGVLTEFFRKGKHIYCTDKKYIAYANKRLKTYKTRRFFVLIKLRIRRVLAKIFRFFFPRKETK